MLDDLFAPPNPEATVTAAPDARDGGQQSSWTQWLQAPSNRAMLISMGAQLMQPSWSGPMANLGTAMAAGMDASASTQRLQSEQDLARDTLSSREREGSANRANALRVAETQAESRLDVAQLRSSAMLERARMIGARSPQQQSQFATLVQRYFQGLSRDNPIAGSGRRTSDELHEQAMTLAQRAMAQSGSLTPEAPPTPPPPTTGPVPPPGNPPPGPPPGPPPSPLRGFWGPGAPAPDASAPAPGAPAPSSRLSWEQFVANSGARGLLSDRQARAELLRRRPEWAEQVRAQMRSWGISE